MCIDCQYENDGTVWENGRGEDAYHSFEFYLRNEQCSKGRTGSFVASINIASPVFSPETDPNKNQEAYFTDIEKRLGDLNVNRTQEMSAKDDGDMTSVLLIICIFLLILIPLIGLGLYLKYRKRNYMLDQLQNLENKPSPNKIPDTEQSTQQNNSGARSHRGKDSITSMIELQGRKLPYYEKENEGGESGGALP